VTWDRGLETWDRGYEARDKGRETEDRVLETGDRGQEKEDRARETGESNKFGFVKKKFFSSCIKKFSELKEETKCFEPKKILYYCTRQCPNAVWA
jgi:hypothetical protein